MDYIPHSPKDVKEMKDFLGIDALIELFNTIPGEILLDDENAFQVLEKSPLESQGLMAQDLEDFIKSKARKNRVYSSIFMGAGCYHHYIPPVVDYLASRGEFWTSYTPYQAEISQGYLQAIFEYQSMISHLTMMKYSNASLHDGATALADATIMALVHGKGKNRIMVPEFLHPSYKSVLHTTLEPRDVLLDTYRIENYMEHLGNDVAAIIIQSPDFFGNIHDVNNFSREIKQEYPNVLIIQCITEALSLGILRPPGSSGVDIAVGECQSFGIPMNFGGPGLGFMGVSDKKLLHKMPGRIVGIARSVNGEDLGYTLTLQAREQHIRRERALSNICSNEALNTLRATVYLASLGSTGLEQLATINYKKANHLRKSLSGIDGWNLVNAHPVFNEFVLHGTQDQARNVIDSCNQIGILGPLELGAFNQDWEGMVSICVTEMNDLDSMNALIDIFSEASSP